MNASSAVIAVRVPPDNYAYIVTSGGAAVVVDPSAAPPVSEELAREGLRLEAILLTHHHADHCGGVRTLKAATGCRVLAADDPRLPPVDQSLAGDETFELLGMQWQALATPGHTRSHLVYHCLALKALFTGDMLFAGGCGRVFEGTAEQMWSSLQRLAALPGDTLVYFGHEYTEDSLQFAQSVLRDDEPVRCRLRQTAERTYKGFATTPSTLALEKATNIFLRSTEPAVKAALGMADAADVEVFAELRRRKDAF